jgi:hypothetical protein
MVEGMGGNAGGALREQEVNCSVGSSNVGIAFVIIGWDIMWVRLVVFECGWLDDGHCRPK